MDLLLLSGVLAPRACVHVAEVVDVEARGEATRDELELGWDGAVPGWTGVTLRCGNAVLPLLSTYTPVLLLVEAPYCVARAIASEVGESVRCASGRVLGIKIGAVTVCGANGGERANTISSECVRCLNGRCDKATSEWS